MAVNFALCLLIGRGISGSLAFNHGFTHSVLSCCLCVMLLALNTRETRVVLVSLPLPDNGLLIITFVVDLGECYFTVRP